MPNFYGIHIRALIVKIQENTPQKYTIICWYFLIIGNLTGHFDLTARRNVVSGTYG
jgi:hypothetical protein